MNKYHYQALKYLIFGCTFAVFSGQIYDHADTYVSYAFSFMAAIQYLNFLRYERKAKEAS